ncbi:MAG TPA: SURF1 family protein [Dermatophilaceae bacterium]|nr:SURF1 family protein [Dermatophilaceae bacterium]
MLRTALTPRWLALLGAVLAVAVAFVLLGRWQLGVAQDKATREALAESAAQRPVGVETVLRPHATFRNAWSARPVTATGTYAGSGQLLVPERRLGGRPGYWVVTPFRVEATGATLPVLRGFVERPEQAGAPPSGGVRLEGGLAPGESPVSGPPLPEGQIGSVDVSLLVNDWPGELYNAFLFLQREAPAATAAAPAADPASLGALTPVPTPRGDVGLNWRNAAYAVQWWVFAAFAVLLWWRALRDESRHRPDPDGGTGPPTGADPGRGTPVPAGENVTRD